MKFEKSCALFFSALCLLAFAATGCDDGPLNHYTPDSNVGMDADVSGQDSGGNADVDQDALSAITDMPWNAGYITITVKTPDGKPADFYLTSIFCPAKAGVPDPEDVWRSGKNVTEHTFVVWAYTEGSELCVRTVRDDHLFTDWKFRAVGNSNQSIVTPYAHEWTEVGSWGANLTGKHDDSFLGEEVNLDTIIKDGKVTLVYATNFYGIITGHTISPDPQNPKTELTGQISADLSEIKLKVVRPLKPENNYETVLTKK